jgi:hypothetical protein
MKPLDFTRYPFERLHDFHDEMIDYFVKLPAAVPRNQVWLHINKWIIEDKASLSGDSFTFNKENLL